MYFSGIPTGVNWAAYKQCIESKKYLVFNINYGSRPVTVLVRFCLSMLS